MKKYIPLLIGFSCLSLAVVAQKQLIGDLPTDRPGNTYNATTLQAGVWQLQSGTEWGGFYSTALFNDDVVLTLPTDLRWGITDRFEIMLSPKFNFTSVTGTEAGMAYTLSAYSLFGRFYLFNGTDYGSMAVLGGYQYLEYAGSMANEQSAIIKLLYKIPLGNRFQIASNLGYSLNAISNSTKTKTHFGQIDYTLNLAYSITPAFGIYAETFGSQSLNSTTNVFWFDGGLYWLPNENLQVDLFYATGSGNSALDYYAALGISYRFGTPR